MKYQTIATVSAWVGVFYEDESVAMSTFVQKVRRQFKKRPDKFPKLEDKDWK